MAGFALEAPALKSFENGAFPFSLSDMIFRVLCILIALCAFRISLADTTRLNPSDMVRTGAFGWLVPKLEVSEPAPTSPAVSSDASDTAAGMLRRLDIRGQAAGLGGVLYDNRDRAHSMLPATLFPQISPLDYAPELRKAGLDYGLAGEILFPVPTLGNSSTAVTDGDAPRSLARLAMTTPLSPARLFRGYATNHLYVYPEHRDHDEIDLYPVNWPYTVISQGSSGSDQAFLQALGMTLAAFPPQTRMRLEEEKLVAPTLQMILRRTQKGSYGVDAYKSGAAHPTVFEAERLSPERMVALAASIAPEDIPPMIRMKVVSEDFGPSADLAGLTEQLFTTPSAIARIWRGPEYTKEITLSVEDTKDPNGRDLQFFWSLFRGEAQKVHILPAEDGQQATIEISWHNPFPINPRQPRLTSRVDIGVIAWNGAQFSAPAFLSVSFPTHQRRVYGPDANAVMRLQAVDYDAQTRAASYDPLLHWSAPWRDTLEYDPAGQLIGLLRKTADGRVISFTGDGVPASGVAIEYQVVKTPVAPPVLEMQDTAEPGFQ